MNKAAVYLRVSSEEQVKGFGLDVQKEKSRDLCKLYEYDLQEHHIYCDEGISGALEERPALNKMFEAAKRKEFDVIVVYRFDRLSRNLFHLLKFVNMLEKLGISVKSFMEQVDTTTPMGKAAFHMFGTFAEWERGVIRERTYGGQIKNKQQGNWVSGIPPYGYDYDKATKKLIVNEDEEKIVKRIFEWLVKDRMSLHGIQERLNVMGVPTKLDNLGKEKKVNGRGFWRKRTIGRIVANEVYTGNFTYNKFERSMAGGKLRPEKDWIMITTPQIIDRETFDLAQEQLKANRKYSTKNAKYTYLFSGMVECGECGGKFHTSYDTGRKNLPDIQKKRYTCNNTHKYVRQDVCKAPSVSEHRLADPIWERIVGLLENPEIAYAQLAKLHEKDANQLEIKARLSETEDLIEKNHLKQKKLLEAFLELDGGLEQKSFLMKKKELEDECNTLIDEKKRYQSLLISDGEKATRIDALQRMFQKLKANLANITYEQKREVLKMLVKKVAISGSKLEVFCNIPYQFAFVGQGTQARNRFLSDWEQRR